MHSPVAVECACGGKLEKASGQQPGAYGSVWREEHPAQRPGKTVYSTQPGVCQGQATEQAGQGHILASGQIIAVLVSLTQRASCTDHSFLT